MVMMMLPTGTQIYLAVAPVDMRKSFDGLSAVVMDTLQQNPLAGHLFLFRGKSGNQIKALFWDRNGLVIWYKRPQKNTVAMDLTELELPLLLDGIDFTKLAKLPHFNAVSAL